MRYIQKNIPWVMRRCAGLNKKQLQKTVLIHFKEHLVGRTIINKCLGHSILITNSGGRKLAYGEALYSDKVELIRIIPEIISESVYNNWGEKKSSDPDSILGYLNFKCKVKIDDQIKHIRLAIKVQKDGKMYWSHEINIVK